MNDSRRRSSIQQFERHRRGIFNADETFKRFLFFCVEPVFIADYASLIPDDLRAPFVEFLAKLPTIDEEWAAYEGVSMLDGDEHSWAEMIAECREATEAARGHLLGSRPSAAGPDFVARVRAAYTARLEPHP